MLVNGFQESKVGGMPASSQCVRCLRWRFFGWRHIGDWGTELMTFLLVALMTIVSLLIVGHAFDEGE